MKQSPPNTAQTLLVVRLTFLQLTQLKVGSSYVSRTGRVQSWPFAFWPSPKTRPHPGPNYSKFRQTKFGFLFTFLRATSSSLPSPSIKSYFLLQKYWRRATRHSHINSSMWRCGVNNTHYTQRCSILSQGPSQRSHFSG